MPSNSSNEGCGQVAKQTAIQIAKYLKKLQIRNPSTLGLKEEGELTLDIAKELLLRYFPTSNVCLMKEDVSNNSNQLTWHINPFVAEHNVIRRTPPYSFMIGWSEKGIIHGVVCYEVYHDVMSYGILGNGFFLESNRKRIIEYPNETSLEEMLLGVDQVTSKIFSLNESEIEIRISGCPINTIVNLACGQLDAVALSQESHFFPYFNFLAQESGGFLQENKNYTIWGSHQSLKKVASLL